MQCNICRTGAFSLSHCWSLLPDVLRLYSSVRHPPPFHPFGNTCFQNNWFILHFRSLRAFLVPCKTFVGILFSDWFKQICPITVLTVYKCHKASWQALTKANAHLNFNFHSISALNQPRSWTVRKIGRDWNLAKYLKSWESLLFSSKEKKFPEMGADRNKKRQTPAC